MQIFWQGKDITRFVQVRECVVRDTSGKRCDGLDMVFENAEAWWQWGPEEDNTIRVYADGYDSGTQYLNTICPEDGKYRILATALPCKARQKEWKSFRQKTLIEILRNRAIATGMGYRLYGIEEDIPIPYIQQENEGAGAFLERLIRLEGGRLKCANGNYVGIGIEWAEAQTPMHRIRVAPGQEGPEYRRSGSTSRGVIVQTPYAIGRATDVMVDESRPVNIISNLPAMNNIQAARWARNLLKARNRESERITIQSRFTPGWTAMIRADICGGTDADGEWIMDEVEHDLINKTSSATLRRCRNTIR